VLPIARYAIFVLPVELFVFVDVLHVVCEVDWISLVVIPGAPSGSPSTVRLFTLVLAVETSLPVVTLLTSCAPVSPRAGNDSLRTVLDGLVADIVDTGPTSLIVSGDKMTAPSSFAEARRLYASPVYVTGQPVRTSEAVTGVPPLTVAVATSVSPFIPPLKGKVSMAEDVLKVKVLVATWLPCSVSVSTAVLLWNGLARKPE
jgi:hypothetical protein